MKEDEKSEINAVVGRVILELLMSHDIITCEILIDSLYEQSQKTDDEVMKLRINGIIHRLLNKMH